MASSLPLVSQLRTACWPIVMVKVLRRRLSILDCQQCKRSQERNQIRQLLCKTTSTQIATTYCIIPTTQRKNLIMWPFINGYNEATVLFCNPLFRLCPGILHSTLGIFLKCYLIPYEQIMYADADDLHVLL